jgi:hypothetical protein
LVNKQIINYQPSLKYFIEQGYDYGKPKQNAARNSKNLSRKGKQAQHGQSLPHESVKIEEKLVYRRKAEN